ncbi:AAA family ATPase [Paenibacillus sp. P3E]|uniref:AAA family ATPase n=1 Tax=Paenibacillus sp. P3E TaxID=1349435 RepID=UPI0021163B86|nr:AAA family ATPase [Paenibacillus sp. P3E]
MALIIIWLNGAFGSGKTSVAYELHRRLPQSFVFDPENTGYYLRENIPHVMSKIDFQDYTLWREINYQMLKYIDSEYRGTVIVPMTVADPIYFMEIIGRLREEGILISQFTLRASRETLLTRLRSRGEEENSWAAQQIDRCVEGLNHEVFHYHLDTEQLSIEDVVECIASQLDITLLPRTS